MTTPPCYSFPLNSFLSISSLLSMSLSCLLTFALISHFLPSLSSHIHPSLSPFPFLRPTQMGRCPVSLLQQVHYRALPRQHSLLCQRASLPTHGAQEHATPTPPRHDTLIGKHARLFACSQGCIAITTMNMHVLVWRYVLLTALPPIVCMT